MAKGGVRVKRLRSRIVLVVVAAMIGATVGGIAISEAQEEPEIHACVVWGIMFNVNDPAQCGQWKSLSWNQTGPQGPPGPPGGGGYAMKYAVTFKFTNEGCEPGWYRLVPAREWGTPVAGWIDQNYANSNVCLDGGIGARGQVFLQPNAEISGTFMNWSTDANSRNHNVSFHTQSDHAIPMACEINPHGNWAGVPIEHPRTVDLDRVSCDASIRGLDASNPPEIILTPEEREAIILDALPSLESAPLVFYEMPVE